MIKQNNINIISFLINISLILIIINSQEIEIPLKLINSTFSKYPIPKTINIKKNSLMNIKTFEKKHRIFLSDSQSILRANIDILSCLLFAGEIEIGSNNQKFNVILDTGSQILWIPEINSNNSNLKIKNFYNPSISKTSKKTNQGFEMLYGTGYCKGYFYQDEINFLTKEKYSIFFGSANNSIFDVDGADGIMGLAKTYPNYLYSPLLILKKNGIIKTSSFSFKYNNKNKQIIFYVGKPHSDFNTDNVASCNLLSKSYYEKLLWACQLNTFGLLKNINNIKDEENIFAEEDISIIFDTGTNLMILPYYFIYSLKEKLRKFNCVIGTSPNDDSEEETNYIICLDIYNIPDVSLQFGDYVLILDKYKMFFIIDLGLDIKGYILNIQFKRNLDVAIIGQNFFIEFHTLFDSEKQVLKFYNEDKSKIINLKNYFSADYENEGESSIGLFIFILIIILLAVFLYYKYKNRQKDDNYTMEWMGDKSKFSNINTRNDYKEMI